MRLSKTFSGIFLYGSVLITGLAISPNPVRSGTTDDGHSHACPTPSAIRSVANWTTDLNIHNGHVTHGECRGTPSLYGITVYSMGFCTADPTTGLTGGVGSTPDYSSCSLTYNNTSGEYTSFSSSSTSNLSSSYSGKPAENTYGFAIIKFAKTFKLKGSYGPLGDGSTLYSNGNAPSNTTANTTTNSSSYAEYDAPLESFGGGTCQSISDPVDRTTLVLKAWLLDSNGDVVSNTGGGGNCSGVQDVLGVAALKSGQELVIDSSTSSLTAIFTVTENGATLYRSGDGGLTMDSGPFNVTFIKE